MRRREWEGGLSGSYFFIYFLRFDFISLTSAIVLFLYLFTTTLAFFEPAYVLLSSSDPGSENIKCIHMYRYVFLLCYV